MNEFEYYVIDRAGDQAYPLLIQDGDCETTLEYFEDYDRSPIPDPQRMSFVFGLPIPKKPVLGDYLSEPSSIVSDKIKDVLEPLKIDGIQLIPCDVTSNKGDVYDNYHYIHVYKHISALDKEKSDYYFDEDIDMYMIEKVVLDKKVLSEIPLNQRLGFRLREAPGYRLFHKSVIDIIESFNPTGVYYVNIEDYEF